MSTAQQQTMQPRSLRVLHIAQAVESAPPRSTTTLAAARHPLSRWYLDPLAFQAAKLLAATRVQPSHVTVAGLACGCIAAGCLVAGGWGNIVAAGAILAAWFCDRVDGHLARLQASATRYGAWLDANVDELSDIGLHVVAVAAYSAHAGVTWPWYALVAFIASKYLFMHGLWTEATPPQNAVIASSPVVHPQTKSLLRTLYHLPANADIRVHLFALSVALNAVPYECGAVALYYFGRAALRYRLVATREPWGWRS